MSTLHKSGYLQFVLTVLVITVIVMGIAIIKSVDLLRDRAERISEQVKDVSSRIDNLENKLANLQISVPSGNTGQTPKASLPKIANREFYDPKAVNGGRLITAISSETKNMNYLVNNEAFVGDIWTYCFDSLAERNYAKPEIFEPRLAESWTLSADKLTYTVKIRQGMLWHDFTDPVNKKTWQDVEVTADDFKFYLDVIKDKNTDCAPSRTYFKDLDRIEVLSKYCFKVFWKRPYFLSESITLGLSPLPRHLYHAYDGPFDGKRFNDDHERNRLVVGCGAFRFDKWDKGQKVVLKRWEKYFGKNLGIMPSLEQIVFEVIKHKNTQLQSLRSNKDEGIDRMSLLPEQWVNQTETPEFSSKGHLLKMKYPARSYNYIGYNLKLPMFQDKRVRQALTHLVDRKRILKEVYYDLGRITTGNFFMDTAYYDKSIKPYPFSVATAKKLFAEAGWKDTDNDGILDKDGKKFAFSILQVADHPIQQRMLPIIKEDMAKAGVVMKINTFEWSVYVQKLEKKSFEVCTLGWRMGFESDPYQIWHSSQTKLDASSNHISFNNKEADELIEKIRVTFDFKERVKLCHRFHALLHEEQPYTFLFTSYALLAQNRRFRNIQIFPGGVPTTIQWVPKAEQRPLQ